MSGRLRQEPLLIINGEGGLAGLLDRCRRHGYRLAMT